MNIQEASKIDRETHKLSSLYSEVRIKVGLSLAKYLYEIESNNLYTKIDARSFPTFGAYISGLGMSYQSCRELIGLYQSFVLAGKYTIKQLSEIPYRKLSIIKPELFRKKDGEYIMIKSKSETNKWISSAKSDLSIQDLKQRRREYSVGEHKCEFEIISFRKCKKCGLRTK